MYPLCVLNLIRVVATFARSLLRGGLSIRLGGRVVHKVATSLAVVALCGSILLANVRSEELKASPHRRVTPVRLADVKWTGGFWHQRFATCRDKMVPSMWKLMKGNAVQALP